MAAKDPVHQELPHTGPSATSRSPGPAHREVWESPNFEVSIYLSIYLDVHNMYTCTDVMYLHVCMYIPTYIHIYIYIYIHTYICISLSTLLW